MTSNILNEKTTQSNRALGEKLADLLVQELPSHFTGKEIGQYISNNSKMLYSKDRLEGVCIIFAPRSQVFYRFATPKGMRKSDTSYYFEVGLRKISPEYAYDIHVNEFTKFLEARYAYRMSQKQLAFNEETILQKVG